MKEVHQAQVEAQLKVWGAQLNVLKAKAEQAGVEVRSELVKHFDELKALEASGAKHLEEIKASSVAAWTDLQSGALATWKKLSSKTSELLAKLE